jgi:heat shock protein HslJ
MLTKSILKLFILLVLLSSCNSKKSTTSTPSDPDKLYESSWILNSWKIDGNDHVIKSMETISLKFNKDEQQVSGNDGCNQFFGTYKIIGDTLQIGPTGGTKKYCGEESSMDERAFISLLQEDVIYEFKDGNLYLKGRKNELIFKADQ